MGGISQLASRFPNSSASPPGTGFQTLLDLRHIEAQPLEKSRRRSVSEETQQDVFGSYGVVVQPDCLDPGILQRALSLRAQRVRVGPGSVW